jgi:N-acetylated-alpha-linked acidic dipeptidase
MRVSFPPLFLLLTLAAAAASPALPAKDEPLAGFDGDHAAAQRALEARFDAALSRDDLREWLKYLSRRPHHLGSAAGKENAAWIAEKFKSWGFDTKIETFSALYPTPKLRKLELLSPEPFTAKLQEPALKEDSTSGQADEQLPTFNVYSVDGDVTGELVYVNYSVPDDYKALAERGIDVKGKIVISRYGGSWRGIKPKVAAEHGAIGCIIYSDPYNDGYFQGDVYPRGAYRNGDGVQRGSVADMPVYAGDPLTPGVGATPEAKRLKLSDVKTLTKIPVLPISYNDALPLLKALGGPVAPEKWRGALPLTYHLGPGPAKVHLQLAFNWTQAEVRDVIATLRGAERPDEWIIRGNHHDGWVNGADDPLSGQVAMLAEAQAVGSLAKTGWKPKRTIVYAAWDGEEPGLIGSTEWAETHAELLQKNGAVYINSDSNGRGFLGLDGSHTLEKFVNGVARDVTDPQKKIPVADRLRAQRVVEADGAEERTEARERTDLRIGALGSGSDFTPFLQHLGMASLNIGYGGEGDGGSYHSIYDSFDHYSRFVDPKFDYGIALAQTAGRMTLRLADADTLPFEFTAFADTLGNYVKEVTQLADKMRADTEEKNRRIHDGTLQAVFDPTLPYVMPAEEASVPHLNFAPLQNALARVKESAKRFDAAMAARRATQPLTPAEQLALDQRLMRMERALTRPAGLPGRPWFVHQIYAPGMYTGYGVKTLPAVREALELRDWKTAEAQVPLVAETLNGYADEIDRAAALLSAGGKPEAAK